MFAALPFANSPIAAPFVITSHASASLSANLPFADMIIATPPIARQFSALSPIAALQLLPEIQNLIYECMHGTPAFRAHRAQHMHVLAEIRRRLAFKRVLQDKASDLSTILQLMWVLGWVDRFSVRQVDVAAVRPEHVRVFPSRDAMLVHEIEWVGVNGPQTITVRRNGYGWLDFMMFSVIRPSDAELMLERYRFQSIIHTHRDIGDVVEDLMLSIQPKAV